jgi:hypothetical protein
MEDFKRKLPLGYGGLLAGVWLVALGMEQNGADHSSNGVWNLVSALRWILSAPIPIAAAVWWVARPQKERPPQIAEHAVPISIAPQVGLVLAAEISADPRKQSADVVPREEAKTQVEPLPQEPPKFSNASEAAASALEELL